MIITANLATLLEIFTVRLVETDLTPRFQQVVVLLLVLVRARGFGDCYDLVVVEVAVPDHRNVRGDGRQDILAALEVITGFFMDALLDHDFDLAVVDDEGKRGG